jgi:hypothetical protein
MPSMAEAMGIYRLVRVVSPFLRGGAGKDLRDSAREVKQIAHDLDALAAMLVPRNWVLFNSLNVTALHDIVTEAEGDANAAERLFVAHLADVGVLKRYLLLARHRPGMAQRGPLIDRALNDQADGRYYSAVNVLLAVMDGYVNDLNPAARKGLAARDPDEMLGWDSVVSLHGGFKRAHAAFTKRCDKLVVEEVFELHRHGIVHGTIVNYDNPVVAGKAWSRLFAVVDWAESLDNLARKKAEPPQPGLRQVLRDASTQREKSRLLREDLAQWSRHTLSQEDEDFDGDAVRQLADRFLSAWQGGKWGLMSPLIMHRLMKETTKKTTGMLRDEYRDSNLTSFTIESVHHVAPVAAEVSVTLVIDGVGKPGVLTWSCEDEEGETQTPNLGGSWRLQTMGPRAILANRPRHIARE